MRRSIGPMAPLALLATIVPTAASSQDVAHYYEENCAVCHTVGRGEQGGPDLKGSLERKDRAWLKRFLLDPEGVVKSGDPYAAAMVARWDGAVMPATEGLTPEMADALLDYIAHLSQNPSPSSRDTPLTPGDPARGRDIFIGAASLGNAGPACHACHAAGPVNGGRLGADLTSVNARLGGERGTRAWLSRPPTPMMRAVFRKATLNEDEAAALAAFFESTAAAGPRSPQDPRPRLAIVGLGGVTLGLVAIGLVWARRFRGVRRRLVGEHVGDKR